MPVTAMATAPSCAACAPSLPHSRSPFTSFDVLFFFSLNGTTSTQQVQARDMPEGIFHSNVTFFVWTVRVLRLHLSALISFWSKERNTKVKNAKSCFCVWEFLCVLLTTPSVRVHTSSTLCTQPLCVFLKCVFKWIFWLLNNEGSRWGRSYTRLRRALSSIPTQILGSSQYVFLPVHSVLKPAVTQQHPQGDVSSLQRAGFAEPRCFNP